MQFSSPTGINERTDFENKSRCTYWLWEFTELLFVISLNRFPYKDTIELDRLLNGRKCLAELAAFRSVVRVLGYRQNIGAFISHEQTLATADLLIAPIHTRLAFGGRVHTHIKPLMPRIA